MVAAALILASPALISITKPRSPDALQLRPPDGQLIQARSSDVSAFRCPRILANGIPKHLTPSYRFAAAIITIVGREGNGIIRQDGKALVRLFVALRAMSSYFAPLMADALHISSRTLQRRLQDEGSSFQKVLEEARHHLARHYLHNSVLELNEAAHLLGYNDPNSFVRAFRTWEGVPPARWRETQRARPAS